MSALTDHDLFEIVTYLATAAPLTYNESTTNNAFRLVDAASRLMRHTDDEFLRERLAALQENTNLVGSDQDAFRVWLGENSRVFTAEALRRSRLSFSDHP